MKYRLWFLQAILVSVFLPSWLGAQIAEHTHPWWVDLGAGPSFVQSSLSYSAGMVYCYQLEQSIISARIIGQTNNNPTIQRWDRSSTIYKMSDYGVLYSACGAIGVMNYSAGAGIGLVRAVYVVNSATTTKTSASVPLEAQWFWRPTRFVGIGVYVYGSLNFERTLSGLLLCAQLGAW